VYECRGSKPRGRPAYEGWNVPIAAERLNIKPNAVAWAPDQRRMNQNAIDAAVWAHDQRQIDAAVWSSDQRHNQTKFIKRRPPNNFNSSVFAVGRSPDGGHSKMGELHPLRLKINCLQIYLEDRNAEH
jgi:hypothetical protein